MSAHLDSKHSRVTATETASEPMCRVAWPGGLAAVAVAITTTNEPKRRAAAVHDWIKEVRFTCRLLAIQGGSLGLLSPTKLSGCFRVIRRFVSAVVDDPEQVLITELDRSAHAIEELYRAVWSMARKQMAETTAAETPDPPATTRWTLERIASTLQSAMSDGMALQHLAHCNAAAAASAAAVDTTSITVAPTSAPPTDLAISAATSIVYRIDTPLHTYTMSDWDRVIRTTVLRKTTTATTMRTHATVSEWMGQQSQRLVINEECDMHSATTPPTTNTTDSHVWYSAMAVQDPWPTFSCLAEGILTTDDIAASGPIVMETLKHVESRIVRHLIRMLVHYDYGFAPSAVVRHLHSMLAVSLLTSSRIGHCAVYDRLHTLAVGLPDLLSAIVHSEGHSGIAVEDRQIDDLPSYVHWTLPVSRETAIRWLVESHHEVSPVVSYDGLHRWLDACLNTMAQRIADVDADDKKIIPLVRTRLHRTVSYLHDQIDGVSAILIPGFDLLTKLNRQCLQPWLVECERRLDTTDAHPTAADQLRDGLALAMFVYTMIEACLTVPEEATPSEASMSAHLDSQQRQTHRRVAALVAAARQKPVEKYEKETAHNEYFHHIDTLLDIPYHAAWVAVRHGARALDQLDFRARDTCATGPLLSFCSCSSSASS